MDEVVDFGGWSFAVREVARPAGWSCRVLVGEDDAVFLALLVSVGPHKIDRELVFRITPEDYAAFTAGELDLGALARRLAEEHEGSNSS